MECLDILKSVEEIVQNVIDDTTVQLTRQTAIGEVPGWDSLSHIRIMLSIEKKFKMKYTAEETDRKLLLGTESRLRRGVIAFGDRITLAQGG